MNLLLILLHVAFGLGIAVAGFYQLIELEREAPTVRRVASVALVVGAVGGTIFLVAGVPEGARWTDGLLKGAVAVWLLPRAVKQGKRVQAERRARRCEAEGVARARGLTLSGSKGGEAGQQQRRA